jgi:hypothetical protein
MAAATIVPSSRVKCREIGTADINQIVNLLARGFPGQTRDHWVRTLKHLSEHPTPAGFPKYGYLLESSGIPVGVSLQIFSSVPVNGETRIRCNPSSWYVEPAFRSYATMLNARGRKREDVTFFNVTPASHTLRILEAQGYIRYCHGWFVAIPALSQQSPGISITTASPAVRRDQDLAPSEAELLLAHAGYGCISITCRLGEHTYPFVFMPRRKFGMSFAYLIYCREIADFVRFAGPLGRFLAKSGIHLVVLDSNGPIRGLVGGYLNTHPKYFKGPFQPRLGDLAYSELAMFPISGKRTWRVWRHNPFRAPVPLG